MKNNNTDATQIFDVHKDAELEAFAKAYVQAANQRNLTMTQSSKIIAQIWREDITNPKVEEKLIRMPLEETEIQKHFRKKVNKFIKQFPEFVYLHDAPAHQEKLKEYTQYTIELICALYKMYLEKREIKTTTFPYYIRDYFKQIFNDPLYYNTTHINHFVTYIFMRLGYLIFNLGDYSGIYRLRYVDKSVFPTLSKQNTFLSKGLGTIDCVSEPYELMLEYDTRKGKSLRQVIQLIWVIKTFF